MDLALQPRQAAIEIWDDDDLDTGGDDFTSRSASLITNATSAPSQPRDSISSRLSMRSDFDSNQGDEERQVHLPGNDQRSTDDAIAAATRAGIPIPQNVPPSALMGGTIKRLGGMKIKKIIQQDDWDDDLVLPDTGKELKIKRQDESNFPDTLRQVNGSEFAQHNPVKSLQGASVFGLTLRPALKTKAAAANLMDKFRDNNDDDFFNDGEATIKVSKIRTPQPVTLIMPPTPKKRVGLDDEDFEADIQLPADGEPLRLSARKEIPKTPINLQDDFDEWGEGSLGTRFGGTRRDGRSNRSSSASALSPSIGSSITIESEDEGLDGLVLPAGPLNLESLLKKRQETQSPVLRPEGRRTTKPVSRKEDFLSDFDIGDEDVFSSTKPTMNRNVKVKSTRITSPTRPKAAVSLVFTNKPTSPVSTRLPRPLVHDRMPLSLEPVSETGGPIQSRQRRSQSRLGGHSTQSSVNGLATPTTPSAHPPTPSTPRRRELMHKTTSFGLRNEPTTTNAQLLKMKRSMPSLKTYPASPAKQVGSLYERPASRTDSGSRLTQVSRPKTPVERDRSGAESSMSQARRNPMPFLPAGASQSQSHHVNIKTSRTFRRHDSEPSNYSTDIRPPSRSFSRTTMRSPSPPRSRVRGAEVLAREAATKKQMTKPRRPRHFGDGLELAGFDDLPTSQQVEQKYTKQPDGRGAPKSHLRNKIVQNIAPDRTTTPTPTTPFSSARHDYLPRFARDTNASRMAREQVLAQRVPHSGASLTGLSNQWKPQAVSKNGVSSTSVQNVKVKKGRPMAQLKPHLIKPLGNLSTNPKSIKGMIYNPATYRWEGNENELSPFDAPAKSPSITSLPPHTFREIESSTPRPALITNISASQGVQVVGGMVFDPQHMRWLKCPPRTSIQSRSVRSDASAGGDTMDGFDALEPFGGDEEDVFKDVPDLEDKPKSPLKDDSDNAPDGDIKKSNIPESGGLKDDWLVGEEFDVGPEFVRRQREEEERWRRKCEKWLGDARSDVNGDEWRWRIREVVRQL